jgi:hypothetical protein
MPQSADIAQRKAVVCRRNAALPLAHRHLRASCQRHDRKSVKASTVRRDRFRRGGATLGPARDGRRRPAFVVVRASRRRRHGPCSARIAGVPRRISPSTTKRFSGTRRRRATVSAGERLLRWPQDRSCDYDAFAVERHGGAAVELVAEFESLAHAPAERVIIGASQESIGRQAVRWRIRHRCIVSQGRRPAQARRTMGIQSWFARLAPTGSGPGRVSIPKAECEGSRPYRLWQLGPASSDVVDGGGAIRNRGEAPRPVAWRSTSSHRGRHKPRARCRRRGRRRCSHAFAEASPFGSLRVKAQGSGAPARGEERVAPPGSASDLLLSSRSTSPATVEQSGDRPAGRLRLVLSGTRDQLSVRRRVRGPRSYASSASS